MTTPSTDDILQLLKPINLVPLPELPLVSVLMVNYNYGRYIGQAIESVLRQSYENFELIICDDGSSDNSWEVIEGYERQDQRVHAVRQPNGGVASALNSAFAESAGQIVCLLDSDDCYLPEKLQVVVEAFHIQADSGYLHHSLYRVDQKGRRRGISPLFRCFPSGWFGPLLLKYGGGMPWGETPCSGLCLRREVAKRIFPIPRHFRRSTDAVVRALSVLMTPVIGVNFPLTEWREHGENLTTTSFVTEEIIDRELRIARDVWGLQRDYLKSIFPALVQAHAPFEKEPAVLQAFYLRKRFRDEKDVIVEYRNLVEDASFAAMPRMSRWFWRGSILLPRPLFRRAYRFYLGPSRLKHWVTWILKPHRPRKHSPPGHCNLSESS